MPAHRARPAATRARRGLMAAAIVLDLGAAHAVEADAVWFTTAAGAKVETPPLEGLDCPAMRAVLAAIDASGYRADAPEPHDKADSALFDYENRLSAAYYADCVRAHAAQAAPHAAFAAGYESAEQ